jgi:hypothetical protein
MDVRRVYDDDRLTVTRGEGAPVHGPSAIHGAAIVYAENAGPASKIGAENRTGMFRLCVYVEPRLRVVGLTTDFDAVVDENGDPLPAGGFQPARRRPRLRHRLLLAKPVPRRPRRASAARSRSSRARCT